MLGAGCCPSTICKCIVCLSDAPVSGGAGAGARNGFK